MAKLSAQTRIKRGITRIERTGWCSGSMRQKWDKTGTKQLSRRSAPVCAVGALMSDPEHKAAMMATSPLLEPAIRAVLRAVNPAPIGGGASAASMLITWNDDLPFPSGKRTVLATFRRALKLLEKEKAK